MGLLNTATFPLKASRGESLGKTGFTILCNIISYIQSHTSHHICYIPLIISKSQIPCTLRKASAGWEYQEAGIIEAPYSLSTTNGTVIMSLVHLRILINKIFSGSKVFAQPHRLLQSFMNKILKKNSHEEFEC